MRCAQRYARCGAQYGERGGTAAQLTTEELQAEIARRRRQVERARAATAAERERDRVERALQQDRERQFLERREDWKQE